MPTNNDDNKIVSKVRTYQIGYAKPPSATRFRKGESGNPAGRPRSSKNLSTILEEELEQRVIIRENGKQKIVTKRRASLKQFINKALAGDPRTLQLLLNYLRDHELKAGKPMALGSDQSETDAMVANLDENDKLTLLDILNKARGGPPRVG
jgi:uncharacterized protein DUF5681